MIKHTITLLVCSLVALQCKAQTSPKAGKLLFADTFETELDTVNWFIELGKETGNSVKTENGKMVIDVNYGAVVWCKKLLGDAWIIEFDRTIPVEGKTNDRLADFNVFWQATDPKNEQFFGRDPAFANYDKLHLYYVGMGGHNNTTTRFRKYKGVDDKEVIQEYTDKAHLLEPNKTYHCRIEFNKNKTAFYIDGELYFAYQDTEPYTGGYFGFRTVRSRQFIDNFKIMAIE